MENSASVEQALSVIQRGAWASAVLAAAFMCGITWLGFHIRARLLSRFERPFFINSLSVIGFLVLFAFSAYLLGTALEPAALLQARIGIYCLPPSRLQFLIPLASGILTGLVYVMLHRQYAERT